METKSGNILKLLQIFYNSHPVLSVIILIVLLAIPTGSTLLYITLTQTQNQSRSLSSTSSTLSATISSTPTSSVSSSIPTIMSSSSRARTIFDNKVSFRGSYLVSTLPERGWSILEFSTSAEYMADKGDYHYTGFTGLAIETTQSKQLRIIGVSPINMKKIGDCRTIYYFDDTDPSYISQLQASYSDVSMQHLSNDYSEFIMLGRRIRRIGTNFYWSTSDEGSFKPECRKDFNALELPEMIGYTATNQADLSEVINSNYYEFQTNSYDHFTDYDWDGYDFLLPTLTSVPERDAFLSKEKSINYTFPTISVAYPTIMTETFSSTDSNQWDHILEVAGAKMFVDYDSNALGNFTDLANEWVTEWGREPISYILNDITPLVTYQVGFPPNPDSSGARAAYHVDDGTVWGYALIIYKLGVIDSGQGALAIKLDGRFEKNILDAVSIAPYVQKIVVAQE